MRRKYTTHPPQPQYTKYLHSFRRLPPHIIRQNSFTEEGRACIHPARWNRSESIHSPGESKYVCPAKTGWSKQVVWRVLQVLYIRPPSRIIKSTITRLGQFLKLLLSTAAQIQIKIQMSSSTLAPKQSGSPRASSAPPALMPQASTGTVLPLPTATEVERQAVLAKYAYMVEEHIKHKKFGFTHDDALRFAAQAVKFVTSLNISTETEARFSLAPLPMYDLAILIGIYLPA